MPAWYVNRLDNRFNANGRNNLDNDNGRFVEYASLLLGLDTKMYNKLCSYENLLLAYKKARKGKTKKRYVKRFQDDLLNKIKLLREELKSFTYTPYRLKVFILRDPKTRKISKSAFRDRVVHHALCNLIVPIFEKSFIYDSHANQIGKGTHKALERFDKFKRKVSKNNTKACYVLKADIKHYFEYVDHSVLLNIISKKIKDKKVFWLIKKILANLPANKLKKQGISKGMPLGNLTSQFFANVYLNELDCFVKHKLKAKYYIRYVDDFVILHHSKKQLEDWKKQIDYFLKSKLKIELHKDKSKVLNLEKGINFLGFRTFYYHKLLRKSNLDNFEIKFNELKIMYKEGLITREKVVESFEGWLTYANCANTFKHRRHRIKLFNKYFKIDKERNNSKKILNFIRKIKESEIKFSVQKTSCLLRKGLNIKEITIKRGIKESTVWEHLANLIKHKQISVFNVLPKKSIFKIYSKIKTKEDNLKEIKLRIKDNSITFNEINCVLSHIKAKTCFKPLLQ